MQATVVKVRLDRVRMKLGLAHGLVGRTDTLANIAVSNDALAAINGSFFEAYDTTAIKNPDHTLITNGAVIHIGNVGSMIGFNARDEARIARVQWTIRGSRNGHSDWPNGWFAYWINRSPSNATVTIFTRAWGTSTGFSSGTGSTGFSTGGLRCLRDRMYITMYPIKSTISAISTCFQYGCGSAGILSTVDGP